MRTASSGEKAARLFLFIQPVLLSFLLFYFILLFFYVEFMHIIHKPTGLTPGLCVGGGGEGLGWEGGRFF